MRGFLYRVRRWLSAGFCAVLAAAVVCMAVAVLVQALAVLVIALLAASLLLPHPLKWYAKEGAEAVRLFVSEVFASPHRGETAACAESKGEVAPPARSDDMQTS